MRGKVAIAGMLAALALPAAAQAHGKPYLTLSRAKAVIHKADRHAVTDGCWHRNRVVVTCTYVEPLKYTGLQVHLAPPPPGYEWRAEWESQVTVTRGHRDTVSWA